MQVLALTVGALEDGSTKYRVAQFLPMFEAAGIEVSITPREAIGETTVAAAAAADVVLNQKCLFDRRLARRIRRAARGVVFDFDDAIWTRPGRPHSWLTARRVRRRLTGWLAEVDCVVCANQHLAAYARAHSDSITVLPMALDTTAWRPREEPPSASGRVRIGWTGSPGNLMYLLELDPVLGRLLDQHPEVTLSVYCGEKPALSVPFEFTPYAPGTEAEFVRSLDIGLLPLPDTDHARGKSPIKCIQYLACGVPVVGNLLGGAAEMCRPEFSVNVAGDGGWLPALNQCISDRDGLKRMGKAGRAFVLATHNAEKCGAALMATLRAVANRELKT
jgi:glycosyltransferase involved in cell wall biosynthesis